MLPIETSKRGATDMLRTLSPSSFLCSPPSQPPSPPPLLCNVRLLERKISQVSSSQCLLHYAMLFLPTKWKMLQTLPILIKHISASVVASSFQTISFKTRAKIKVSFFPSFCCAVDPHWVICFFFFSFFFLFTFWSRKGLTSNCLKEWNFL